MPSYGQPTPARQPPSTAYERHASNRYRPSDRNGRTSNLRHELNYEEIPPPPPSYPAFRNQGTSTSFTPSGRGVPPPPPSYPAYRNQSSSTSFTPSGTTGYGTFDKFQQSRQQPRWDQNNGHRGSYGDRNVGQASPTAPFQHSPYLLPGQVPHDVNNPPPGFQPRFSTPQGVHTTPSARQGYPATENAVNVRPQSTSAPTGGVHPAQNESEAAEESEEEPRKQTNKKKRGPPNHRPETLKKTMLKQGETKMENGQLMWSDPNEPEEQKWKPAVIMDDIRKYILRQQNREAQALGCSYLYPDEAGGDPFGDTAFFYPHRDIGGARDTRPDILFEIDETETNNPQPSYDPGWMVRTSPAHYTSVYTNREPRNIVSGLPCSA